MAGESSSLTHCVVPFDAGDHVIAAAFIGAQPALALTDGNVRLGDDAQEKRVAAHPNGSILVAAADAGRLMTGGDDGRVVAIDSEGKATELADEKGKWIDAIAARAGAVAWSVGKNARVRDAEGSVKSWSAPTTVRGMAFLPKGYRLALAHYNGVSLWFPNTAAAPCPSDHLYP